MAIDTDSRFGVAIATAGADAVSRSQIMGNFDLLRDNAAKWATGPIGDRPAAAAANAGMVWITASGSVSWSNGTVWLGQDGSFIDARDYVIPRTNIHNFGASGVSYPDVSTGLNAAIAAAIAASLPLYLAAGAYDIDDALVGDALTIIGARSGKTILHVRTTGEAGISAGQYLSMSGVSVIHAGYGTPTCGVEVIGATGCDIDDVLVSAIDGRFSVASINTTTPDPGDFDPDGTGQAWRMHKVMVTDYDSTRTPVGIGLAGAGSAELSSVYVAGPTASIKGSGSDLDRVDINGARLRDAAGKSIDWATDAPLIARGIVSDGSARLMDVGTASTASVAITDSTFYADGVSDNEHIRWFGCHGVLSLTRLAFPRQGSLVPKVKFYSNASKHTALVTQGCSGTSDPELSNVAAGLLAFDAGTVAESHTAWAKLDQTTGAITAIVP